MTNDELYSILKKNRGWETDTETVLKLIWGQPFDGETERINTAKSASPTSPATEESSVTLSIGNEADFVTKSIPLYICKTCDHEWDSDEWYCVACNTPYRIPNPTQRK